MLKFQKEVENPKGLKILSLNNLFSTAASLLNQLLLTPKGASHMGLYLWVFLMILFL